jgi:hypothetical protein
VHAHIRGALGDNVAEVPLADGAFPHADVACACGMGHRSSAVARGLLDEMAALARG